MGDSRLFHTPATPVPVLQRQDEFARLLALYRERRPRRVVEVGTYHGGTLYHWLRNAAPGAVVVSLDSYTTGVDNRALYDAWRPPGVTLHALAGDSRDPALAAQVRDLVGEADWLFIDAGHFEPEVRGDYALYAPLVADSGVIVLHDILDHPAHPELQVWRLWRDIRASGARTEEIISDPNQDDCGIGVQYVGAADENPAKPGAD